MFTKRAIAADLGEWLDAQNLRDVVLVGHDWGGTIAWMLAATRHDLIHRLVTEEEVLPGAEVVRSEPGASHYPTWHAPLNRAVGLFEALVPDRKYAYFGAFLAESAVSAGLEPDAIRKYLAAYRSPATLAATAAYYRTRPTDVADVAALCSAADSVRILAIGGQFAMGPTVAGASLTRATSVTCKRPTAATWRCSNELRGRTRIPKPRVSRITVCRNKRSPKGPESSHVHK